MRGLKYFVISIIGVFSVSCFSGCHKDDDVIIVGEGETIDLNYLPVVIMTGETEDVKMTSATVEGYFSFDDKGLGQEYEREIGIVYGSGRDDSDLIYKNSAYNQDGNISVKLKDLNPGTKYYYSTFLRITTPDQSKLWRGEWKEFTTLKGEEAVVTLESATDNFHFYNDYERFFTCDITLYGKINLDEISVENIPSYGFIINDELYRVNNIDYKTGDFSFTEYDMHFYSDYIHYKAYIQLGQDYYFGEEKEIIVIRPIH